MTNHRNHRTQPVETGTPCRIAEVTVFPVRLSGKQWPGFQVKVECVNVCESVNRRSDLSAASGGISRNLTVVSRRVGLSDTDVFGGPEMFFFTPPPNPSYITNIDLIQGQKNVSGGSQWQTRPPGRTSLTWKYMALNVNSSFYQHK